MTLPGFAPSRFLQHTLRAAQFTALALIVTLLAGCAHRAYVRHEIRDDRRDDRQDDRHDRRDDRRDRW